MLGIGSVAWEDGQKPSAETAEDLGFALGISG